MPTVEVIVPFHGNDPWRVRALGWVTGRYRFEYPTWKITVAETRSEPWVKANAVNPAARASTADVLIISDGDVWCDAVDEAVIAVAAGKHRWAAAHWRTHRFTPQFTERVYAGADPNQHTSDSLEERPYHGIPGGGLIVTDRATMLNVPLDPRFTGWGGEDVSWGVALRTLAGRPWRGAAPLYHLWHPPQDRPARSVLPPHNDQLRRRYYSARGRPRAMRALLDEIPNQQGAQP